MILPHSRFMLALFALVLLVALLVPGPARPHSWYPYRCCSGRDCFEAGPAAIVATHDGWRIESSGEVIPFDDPRVNPTPPEGGQVFHVCFLAADPTARALCLFVPEFGS